MAYSHMPRPKTEYPMANSTTDRPPPVVMTIAGCDPSGGAGVVADIQAISAHGCHPAAVITALTVQDTKNAYRVVATDADLVVEQADAVLADVAVHAIKIGLLPSESVVRAVASLLAQHGAVPVVLDPVLIASGGADLATDPVADAILDTLVPLATIVTPNAHEIRSMGGDAGDRRKRARRLLDRGCRYVLVKGADEATTAVENAMYGSDGFEEVYRWRRLPHPYHGSGCTLASAIAAGIARGRPIQVAVAEAQRYTWEALKTGFRPGNGQWVPRRCEWNNDT